MRSTQLKPTLRIMFIEEFAASIGLSIPSVYRLIRQARRGEGNTCVPLPFSPPGTKCRWLASDVESYLLSQSNRAPPITRPVTSTNKLRSTNESFARREQEIKRRLELHRVTNRKIIKEDWWIGKDKTVNAKLLSLSKSWHKTVPGNGAG